MGKNNIFVFDPDFWFSDTIDYPQDADAINIMSFGYLGGTVKTPRIADISNNDLRVWEFKYLLYGIWCTGPISLNRFCSNDHKRVAVSTSMMETLCIYTPISMGFLLPTQVQTSLCQSLVLTNQILVPFS